MAGGPSAQDNAVGHLHLGQKGHFLEVLGLLSLSISLLCAKDTWYGDIQRQQSDSSPCPRFWAGVLHVPITGKSKP